jgi:hypothetical protein
MTLQELELNIRQAAAELREANALLKQAAQDWPHAERRYRQAYAEAFVRLCENPDARRMTNPEKDARCTLETSDQWLAAHLAEGSLTAARELVRSLQATLSAWQTLSNNLRAELDLTRYPHENRPVAAPRPPQPAR